MMRKRRKMIGKKPCNDNREEGGGYGRTISKLVRHKIIPPGEGALGKVFFPIQHVAVYQHAVTTYSQNIQLFKPN